MGYAATKSGFLAVITWDGICAVSPFYIPEEEYVYLLNNEGEEIMLEYSGEYYMIYNLSRAVCMFCRGPGT